MKQTMLRIISYFRFQTSATIDAVMQVLYGNAITKIMPMICNKSHSKHIRSFIVGQLNTKNKKYHKFFFGVEQIYDLMND